MPDPCCASLYVHVPFCRRRCTYCDFNTYSGRDSLIEPYVAAVMRELQSMREHSLFGQSWQPATLYLGGGTPSLLPVSSIDAIIGAANLPADAEVTLECNPEALQMSLVRRLKSAGVSRLSLGMQSYLPQELAILGRMHEHEDVASAVRWSRMAGLESVSLDLMFGLPGQLLSSWQETLLAATALEPDHLSLYALTIENTTLLAEQVRTGQLPSPDAERTADMYDHARDYLSTRGYQQYEISNWALPEHECRHNLAYWRNEPYLGIGAGAWGHWPSRHGSWRMRNVRDPAVYISRADPQKDMTGYHWGQVRSIPISAAASEVEWIPLPMAMSETMFMGLRMITEGISRDAFLQRFGSDPARVYQTELQELTQQGLIAFDDQRIRLAANAAFLSNQVFVAFVPESQKGGEV